MSATTYSPDHVWTTQRKARKSHHCDWCGGVITAGSVYTEFRCSPAHEYGSGVWSRIKWHQRRDGRCLR